MFMRRELSQLCIRRARVSEFTATACDQERSVLRGAATAALPTGARLSATTGAGLERSLGVRTNTHWAGGYPMGSSGVLNGSTVGTSLAPVGLGLLLLVSSPSRPPAGASHLAPRPRPDRRRRRARLQAPCNSTAMLLLYCTVFLSIRRTVGSGRCHVMGADVLVVFPESAQLARTTSVYSAHAAPRPAGQDRTDCS